MPPEEALAEQFRVTMLPHLGSAYNYSRFLTRDSLIAEEITQDAFLKAFRSFAQCRGNERAWLMAIVRNCFRDWLKRNRSGGEFSQIMVDAPEIEPPDVRQERADDVALVRSTIAQLPEPFREALILREIEDLSYREIAEITDSPIGTVMSRLSRARVMLSALLHESNDGRDSG